MNEKDWEYRYQRQCVGKHTYWNALRAEIGDAAEKQRWGILQRQLHILSLIAFVLFMLGGTAILWAVDKMWRLAA